MSINKESICKKCGHEGWSLISDPTNLEALTLMCERCTNIRSIIVADI